jgi:release factor glutamine methyltransferase
MNSIKNLLAQANKRLQAVGIETARMETEWILEHLTGWTRTKILAYPELIVPNDIVAQFEEHLARREKREPIQYILGETEFYGFPFHVTPAVLIPRPETELLVEEALKMLHADLHTEKGDTCKQLLDIGTGSGCIPIVLKKQYPEMEVWGCDISKAALAIANKNAANLQVEVKWVQADVLSMDFLALKQHLFDGIVSNPPYILEDEGHTLQPEVVQHEPHLALFVENDALQFYRAIAHHAQRLLKPHGFLLFECHCDYAEQVQQLLLEQGFQEVFLRRDYAGLPRIVGGRHSA